jgi:hypothetical protein
MTEAQIKPPKALPPASATTVLRHGAKQPVKREAFPSSEGARDLAPKENSI